MSVNTLIWQTTKSAPGKSNLRSGGLFSRRGVLAVALSLFVFFAAQFAFGAVLPQSLSLVPGSAYAAAINDVHPSGVEVPARASAITVNFAQAMDTAQALSATDLTISGSTGVSLNLSAANWSADGMALTVPLFGNLEPATAYTVNVGGLSSDLGIPSLANHTHMFTTAAADALSYVTQIAVSDSHTVAVRNDGSLWIWGANGFGQLGLGDTAQRLIPTEVPVPGYESYGWIAASAGTAHTVALKDDGTLWAWGFNGRGRLGLGDTLQRLVPTEVPVPGGSAYYWTAASAGDAHTHAIRSDGTLWAWGNNDHGRLGVGTISAAAYPNPVEVTALGASGGWKAVSAATNHTTALRVDGTLWAWGNNNQGQLGTGSITAPQSEPVQIGGDTDWAALSAGNVHNLALKDDGTLWAWGSNAQGRLGLGVTSPPVLTPTEVLLDGASGGWTAVSAGQAHSLAVRDDGTLWTWGVNADGQLGLGDDTQRLEPTAVDLDVSDEIVLPDGGRNFFTVVALDDGTLWAWGDNSSGQLANGVVDGGSDNWLPWRVVASLQSEGNDWAATDNATVPHNAAVDVDVLVGRNHISLRFDRPMRSDVPGVIIVDNGALVNMSAGHWSADNMVFTAPLTLVATQTLHEVTVRGFADDFLGQEVSEFGWSFTTGERILPEDAIKIAAGLGHTLAIQADGTLWAWGSNANGQLGLGDTASRNIPILVSNDEWIEVSAGANHSLAIRADGTLWAFGGNANGRLGLGDTNQRLVPTEVPTAGISGDEWVAVSAGNAHSLGLRDNGELYVWGSGANGRLGLGSDTNQRTTPVQLPTAGISGSEWINVSAGHSHTLAIRDNGELYVWGNGANSRLGLGADVSDRTTPVQLPTAGISGSEWISVSTGNAHTLAIRDDGSMWAWGNNNAGRLGVGDSFLRTEPTQVLTAGVSGSEWTAVSAGNTHTMALRDSGQIYVWGANGSGQLGLSSTQPSQLAPIALPTAGMNIDEWIAISVGTEASHVVAVCNDGTLWSWGNNGSGQLAKGVSGAFENAPWRIAAALQSVDANTWAVAGDATAPYAGEIDVHMTTDRVHVHFDRPMRTEAQLLGSITIDSGASIDVTTSTASWSPDGMTFSAPMDLVATETTHTVEISGFVDTFSSISKIDNEMYPYTWIFVTESPREGDDLVLDERACATCHFSSSLKREHQFVASRGLALQWAGYDHKYGCQKCHGQDFNDVDKINWSSQSPTAEAKRMGDIDEMGCLSCHGSSDNPIHGGAEGMMQAHITEDPSDTGCSSCHGTIVLGSDTGFGFGEMDLASAHADFWLAVSEDRVAEPATVSEPMKDADNFFGCGTCHAKTGEEHRLRAPIAAHTEVARGNGTLTCSTCHVVPDGADPLEMTMHFTQRRVDPDLADLLGISGVAAPLQASQSALDFVDALSAQTRAELNLGDVTGGNLAPEVLDSSNSSPCSSCDPCDPELCEAGYCCESGSCETTPTARLLNGVWVYCECIFNCCDDPTCTTCFCSPAFISDCPFCGAQNVCICPVNDKFCDFQPCPCQNPTPIPPQVTPPTGDDDDGETSPPGHPAPGPGDTPPANDAGDDEAPPAENDGDAGTEEDASNDTTTPTASPESGTGDGSSDATAGPRTGDTNNWYFQIATLAALIAALAAMGLFRSRRYGDMSS